MLASNRVEPSTGDSGSVKQSLGSFRYSGKFEIPVSQKKYEVDTHQVYLLGIAIVIGGQLFSWNVGLEAGFYTAFVSLLFIGSGYLCLCLCLSELTGMLPFAGGAYGFSRVALNPYLGFMVGCETVRSIMYVPASLIVFGSLLTQLFGTPSSLEPVWWLLFYVISLALFIRGGKVFWDFSVGIGLVSLLLVIVYCLGSIPALDFAMYVTALNEEASTADASSVTSFMRYVHLASWYYIGVEGLPLSCSDARNVS